METESLFSAPCNNFPCVRLWIPMRNVNLCRFVVGECCGRIANDWRSV